MKTIFSAASAVATLAAATSASAADVTVSYTVAAAAVPTLSEWAMILMCVALAGAAVMVLRRRGLGKGTAYGLAALMGVGAIGFAADTRALTYGLSLTGTGSDTLPVANFQSHNVTVTNNATSEVTITSVTATTALLPFIGTTCNAGTILPVGGTCVVDLLYVGPPPT